ncbi:MAG: hypothetical protein ACJ8KX_02485 [Chthoniobacterales bacterium]
MKRAFRFLLILFLASRAAPAQEPSPPPPLSWPDLIGQGVVPYHQLTVEDFAINDEAKTNDAFYIKTAIEPRSHYYLKPYNGFVFAFVDQWIVFSGLRKTETTRRSEFKEMKASLPFAQALLDLSEIYARQLAAIKPGELPQARGDDAEKAKAEMERKLKELVDAKLKALYDEQAAFVKATDGGRNTKKVQERAAEIRKRLDATPNATVPFHPPEF